MAATTCGQCKGSTFELVTQRPTNSQFPINFVQCASCGSVVGVLEEHNAGEVAYKLEGILKKIASKLEIDI